MSSKVGGELWPKDELADLRPERFQEGTRGSLEPGKLADIVVVDGDPLKNIKILQDRKKIQMVIKDGDVVVDRRPGCDVRVIQAEYKSWKIADA